MINYKLNSQEINIHGKDVSLPAALWSVEEYNNLILVTIHPDYSNTNITAYNQAGNLVWTIERRPYVDPDIKGPKRYNGTYVANGELIAIAYVNFIIDQYTGKIIKQLPFSK